MLKYWFWLKIVYVTIKLINFSWYIWHTVCKGITTPHVAWAKYSNDIKRRNDVSETYKDYLAKDQEKPGYIWAAGPKLCRYFCKRLEKVSSNKFEVAKSWNRSIEMSNSLLNPYDGLRYEREFTFLADFFLILCH